MIAQDRPSTPAPLIAYDMAEACRQVCLSDDTLRAAIKAGALKARLAGRKYIIRHEDLCAWVNSLPPAEAQA